LEKIERPDTILLTEYCAKDENLYYTYMPQKQDLPKNGQYQLLLLKP
jgi:hypothetical protein